jgi:hypothetical protein
MNKKTINVAFCYDWAIDENGKSLESASYTFIRKEVKKAADGVISTQKKRKGPPLSIIWRRMRMKHGASLLSVLKRRILEADILIYDITTRNPNVMFELGIGIASKSEEDSVFILERKNSKSEADRKIPSDLSGYFISFYEFSEDSKTGEFRFRDPKGFQAAIRSEMIKVARELGVWEESSGFSEDETESIAEVKVVKKNPTKRKTI